MQVTACIVPIVYLAKSLSKNDLATCHLILSYLCSHWYFSVPGYFILMTRTWVRSSGWHPRNHSAFLYHSYAILTLERGARQEIWADHHFFATIINTVLFLFKISFLQHFCRFNQKFIYLHQKRSHRSWDCYFYWKRLAIFLLV